MERDNVPFAERGSWVGHGEKWVMRPMICVNDQVATFAFLVVFTFKR